MDFIKSQIPSPPIFLFDGVCNLCNGAVDFVIQHEKSSEILFLAIQSDDGQRLLSRFGKDRLVLETLYVYNDGILLERSKAVIFLIKYLEKPWSFLKILNIFPVFFLDVVYDVIAKNRYRLFGKKETCRIPTEAEKYRFL